MTHGKQTCKILKEIRKQIAEKNDIAFVTKKCRHKGDCAGICPACEAVYSSYELPITIGPAE